jgi:hypothetical protein
MSMIVEKFPTLPPGPVTLFDLYYRTVYDREVAKPLPVARFLSDNRQEIDRIHEQVGLLLQVQSETASGADAVLPADELRKPPITRTGATPGCSQRAASWWDPNASRRSSWRCCDPSRTRRGRSAEDCPWHRTWPPR